MQQRPLGKFY